MEKQRWESQRREDNNQEDQREEKVRRKKMQAQEKVEKSRVTVFFPLICGSGGSQSMLAQAAGTKPSGQMHALWRTFASEKAPHHRSTFGS